MVKLMDFGIRLKESRTFSKRLLGQVVLLLPRGYAAWLIWKTEKKYR